MTDEELTMWQYLDESRDRIEALEAKNKELETAFAVFMTLIAEKMEINNGVQTTQDGGTANGSTSSYNRRWFKS